MKSKTKFAFAILLLVVAMVAACTKPTETATDKTGQDTVVNEAMDTTSADAVQDTTASN